RFVFSGRRRHTRWPRDWSSDVCSSDLQELEAAVVLCPQVSVMSEQPHGFEQQIVEVHRVGEAQTRLIVVVHLREPPRLGVFRLRSEERRVGKECRCRWAPDRQKKKSCG